MRACVHFLVGVLLTTLAFAIVPSDLSCDDLDSCSPAQCVVSTDADCPTVNKVYDFAQNIADTTCRECIQSTAARCSELAASWKKNSGVAAVYCTDEFLVIWATGLPEYLVTEDYLGGIPLPPGGDTACRVRTGIVQPNVYKVPVSGVAPPASGSNVLPQPLPGVPGMPEAGAVGVALDGVPMFPNYNNRGQPTWVSCEVDRCNAHSGKGLDYHYHGDPFGAKCLYSASDYSGDHPPLIGWALDGYSIHGKYISALNFSEGVDVELDACGGHSHSTLGYHYHSATTVNEVATNGLDGAPGSQGATYTAYRLAPAECWRGDVGSIENFWAGNQASYDRSKVSVENSGDYEQLRPCCGSTRFAVAQGITIDGAGECQDTQCSLGEMSTSNSGTTATSATTSSGGGTCSGTDDQGMACPPDVNDQGMCPPGCTLVAGGATTSASTLSPTTASPSSAASVPNFCSGTVGISMLSLLLVNWNEPLEDLMERFNLCVTK